jgi:predicted secreted protein with PEFG-CTERM motif
LKIKLKNFFLMLILVISIIILAENHPLVFGYAIPVSNSTNPSMTIPPPTHQYPSCPSNYTPANFPCTVHVGGYTKVVGAPHNLNQLSVTTPAVPEFGSLAGMIMIISIISAVLISRKLSYRAL